MLVAVLDEDRIAAPILNDVGPELAMPGSSGSAAMSGPSRASRAGRKRRAAVKANQRGLPAHWGADDWDALARRLCSEREDGSIRFDYDPAIAVPFATARRPTVDMWPLFDALARKPVLAVRGEHSELFTAEALERLGQRSANVTTVTVPGVGHPPELSEPEAVAAIDAFLARARRLLAAAREESAGRAARRPRRSAATGSIRCSSRRHLSSAGGDTVKRDRGRVAAQLLVPAEPERTRRAWPACLRVGDEAS